MASLELLLFQREEIGQRTIPFYQSRGQGDTTYAELILYFCDCWHDYVDACIAAGCHRHISAKALLPTRSCIVLAIVIALLVHSPLSVCPTDPMVQLTWCTMKRSSFILFTSYKTSRIGFYIDPPSRYPLSSLVTASSYFALALPLYILRSHNTLPLYSSERERDRQNMCLQSD